eukprot:948929-Rhodomonas_salina.1
MYQFSTIDIKKVLPEVRGLYVPIGPVRMPSLDTSSLVPGRVPEYPGTRVHVTRVHDFASCGQRSYRRPGRTRVIRLPGYPGSRLILVDGM